MSGIRHPKIVQYLGMYRDSADTHLPVLLMELMDDSLTHFLESSPQPIPYHIAVNICNDVTQAISFLHSNNIVHRDLSSNNILIQGNILAKVTDFGMAKLGDIIPSFTTTTCPGTDVYMPPEAVQDTPLYTEKIGCFSFGVIILQILTQLFPKPGDRMQEVGFNHPGFPSGAVLVRMPEVSRRQNHISKVDPDHPLLPVILDCLKDKDDERPSAHQLCERIAELKGMEKYINSARMVSLKEEKYQQLMQQLQHKDQVIAQLERDKNHVLIEKERQLQERDEARRQSEERERQLEQVNQQLKQAEQVIVQLRSLRDQQNPEAKKELANIKLKWRLRAGKRAPCGMYRWCDAVVNGNTVYVRDGGSVKIYSYDATTDSWSQLPDCVIPNGSITVIDGELTTVGGDRSNELFSLTGQNRRIWTKKYPPMPTKRRCTISLCTGARLIVAGGVGEGAVVLSTVEVMNTVNHQWFTAADLPQPMYIASATVCGDCIYMLGGVGERITSIKSVYTCSVSDLIQSCVPNSLESRTSLSDKASVCMETSC